jgi:hypothetical protein
LTVLHLLAAGYGTNATNRHVHSNDRFGGQSRLDMLTSNLSGFDPQQTSELDCPGSAAGVTQSAYDILIPGRRRRRLRCAQSLPVSHRDFPPLVRNQSCLAERVQGDCDARPVDGKHK